MDWNSQHKFITSCQPFTQCWILLRKQTTSMSLLLLTEQAAVSSPSQKECINSCQAEHYPLLPTCIDNLINNYDDCKYLHLYIGSPTALTLAFICISKRRFIILRFLYPSAQEVYSQERITVTSNQGHLQLQTIWPTTG